MLADFLIFEVVLGQRHAVHGCGAFELGLTFNGGNERV